MKNSSNPVVYFEIPVNDMARAMAFYSAVFGFDFEMDTIDGNMMAYFPSAGGETGVSGALAKGETYKPTLHGTLVYFAVTDIDRALSVAENSGGSVLFPKTSNDGSYFIAEIEDSEGNRIGLHMRT